MSQFSYHTETEVKEHLECYCGRCSDEAKDMASGSSCPQPLSMAISLPQLFPKSTEDVEHTPVLPSRNFIQGSNEVGGGRVCGKGLLYLNICRAL